MILTQSYEHTCDIIFGYYNLNMELYIVKFYFCKSGNEYITEYSLLNNEADSLLILSHISE